MKKISNVKQILLTLIMLGVMFVIFEFTSWTALKILAHSKHIYSETDLPIAVDKKLKNIFLKTSQLDEQDILENYHRFDRELGWTLNPNKIYGKVKDIVVASTNNIAVRSSSDYAQTPPPGKFRIAAFGDSFVHGSSVTNAMTFTQYLENLNPKYEVLNFGVSGYGTDQAYLRYKKYGASFKPHIVLICYMSENLARNVNVYRGFYERGSISTQVKPRFFLENNKLKFYPNPIQILSDYQHMTNINFLKEIAQVDYWAEYLPKESVFERLNTVKVIKIMYREWFSKNSSREMGVDSITSKFLTPTEHHYIYNTESEPYKLTIKIIQNFYQDVKSNGSIPIIVLFPDIYDLKMNLQYGEKVRYQPLADELKSMGLAVADTQYPLINGVKEYGLSEVTQSHYKPKGNALVAFFLNNYIKNLFSGSTSKSKSPLELDLVK